MRPQSAILFALGALVGTGILTGCGGQASLATAELPQCASTFITPNYADADDPQTGRDNVLLRWPAFPVKVYFRNEATLPGGASAQGLWNEAADRWESVAGTTLFATTGSETDADIVVEFRSHSSTPIGANRATTSVTWDPTQRMLKRAETIIGVWPTMTPDQAGPGFRGLLTKQIGHALFLRGSSPNAEDAMFATTNLSEDRPLSTRDRNSLLTAYCSQFRRR